MDRNRDREVIFFGGGGVNGAESLRLKENDVFPYNTQTPNFVVFSTSYFDILRQISIKIIYVGQNHYGFYSLDFSIMGSA